MAHCRSACGNWSASCAASGLSSTQRSMHLNGELGDLAHRDAADRRLTWIPGVGVLNATALIAAVGDASDFARGRSSCLPRPGPQAVDNRRQGQAAWHLKARQRVFAHLAHPRRRAALPSLSQSDTPSGRWLKAMIGRGAHRNAALVNKLARIAWEVLRKETTYERGCAVEV